MKREQIIEILKTHQTPMAGHSWLLGIGNGDFEKVADAILALPLDVPKTKEINAIAHRVYKDAYNPDGCVEDAFKYGMKTAIDEIIKRNRVI